MKYKMGSSDAHVYFVVPDHSGGKWEEGSENLRMFTMHKENQTHNSHTFAVALSSRGKFFCLTVALALYTHLALVFVHDAAMLLNPLVSKPKSSSVLYMCSVMGIGILLSRFRALQRWPNIVCAQTHI